MGDYSFTLKKRHAEVVDKNVIHMLPITLKAPKKTFKILIGCAVTITVTLENATIYVSIYLHININ